MSIDVFRRYVSEALDRAVKEAGGTLSVREFPDGSGHLYMVSTKDITDGDEEQELIVNFEKEYTRPRYVQLELPFDEEDEDVSDSE